MENTFESTIDNSKLCLKPKNMFEKNLNHDLVLEGAQTLKLATVNIGATDFLEKKPHLVMGLMWQIIKVRNQVLAVHCSSVGAYLVCCFCIYFSVLLVWLNVRFVESAYAQNLPLYGPEQACGSRRGD